MGVPSSRLSTDPLSELVRRHHVHENSLRKIVRTAAQLSRMQKRITPHTYCHSFSSHILETGSFVTQDRPPRTCSIKVSRAQPVGRVKQSVTVNGEIFSSTIPPCPLSLCSCRAITQPKRSAKLCAAWHYSHSLILKSSP